MTSQAISKSPFFWETFSKFQQLKIRLGFQNSQIEELKKKLNTFSFTVFEQKLDQTIVTPLHQAVAYVANFSDPAIERIIAKKFHAATPLQRFSALAHLTHFSFDYPYKNMIGVCQRVMDLDLLKETYGVKGSLNFVVKGMARHITKKEKPTITAVSHSAWLGGYLNPAAISQALFYSINLFSMAYGIDFTEKPSGRWAAQYQISFFRTTLTDLHWLGTHYLKYFASPRKAAWVTTGILVALVGVYFFSQRILSFMPWFKLSKPAPSFDKQLFSNLNEDARAGKITPSFGREKDLDRVENLLSSTSSTTAPIVMLIGPSGAGKSKIMEGLALRIIKKQTARLNEKIVIVGNTADMGEKGFYSETRYHSRIDMILEGLKVAEGNVILCLDEAHMLKKEGAEKIKTVADQKGIKLILASTPEEFNNSFLKQNPIFTRSQIVPIYSLDPDNTRYTLLTLLSLNPDIPATPGAIDALLELSSKLSGAEPRKSLYLLNYLIQVVYAAVPKASRLLPLLHRKYLEATTAYVDLVNSKGSYCLSQQGLYDINTLNLLADSIELLEKNHQHKLKIFSIIKEFKMIEAKYLEERNSLVKELAQRGNPSKERQFLFILKTVLPVLQEQITQLMPDLTTTKVAAETAAKLLEQKIITSKELKDCSPEIPENISFIIDEKLINDKRGELILRNQDILKTFVAPSPPPKLVSSLKRSPSSGQVAPIPYPESPSAPREVSSMKRRVSLDETKMKKIAAAKSEPSLHPDAHLESE